VPMSRRRLSQMLTAGALRGILPAGLLSIDDADRLIPYCRTTGPHGHSGQDWSAIIRVTAAF
jgi:hypothetical protein